MGPAEQIARALHGALQRAADDAGWVTEESTWDSTESTWDSTEEADRNVVIAGVQRLLDAGEITTGEALRTYGRHFEGCRFLLPGGGSCSCGFGEVCR